MGQREREYTWYAEMVAVAEGVGRRGAGRGQRSQLPSFVLAAEPRTRRIGLQSQYGDRDCKQSKSRTSEGPVIFNVRHCVI